MSAYISLPLRLFPSPLAEYVRQAAAALDCDPAYIAVPMLPVLASAIGNTRRIRLKQSWSEPAVIWAATVGESGTVKSPALEMATQPVWRRQHELLKAHIATMTEHRVELAGWKSTPKPERGAEPDAPPACEHPLCSDITIEALADRLQATPRGTLLALDELAAWFGSFNAYKSRGGDVAHWLALHGARALKVDRKTGDKTTIYIPHAAASITGTIQPATLRRVLLPEFFDNGLAARLLLAMPPVKPKTWSDDEIEPELSAAVDDLFAHLYALRPADGIDGDKTPLMVDLTGDALERLKEFVNSHGEAAADLENDVRAAWSKLEGYAARFALIFHCVRQASGGKEMDYIDGDDIANGIELARWFGGETQRVYRAISESTEGRQRRELLDWIASHGGRATVRDLCRGPRRYRNNSELADSDLNDLEKDAFGSWEAIRPGVRGGAPTRVFCLADSPDFPVATRGDGDTTDENHWETVIPSPVATSLEK